jgi:hypothetical protein
MNNELTNLFTYLKSHHDYAQAFDQLKRIFNPYFENITNYDLIEETFIECLIPAIHYYDDNKCAKRIHTILRGVTMCLTSDNRKDFIEISTNNMTEISKEINNLRNDFSCLKYYNDSGVEPKNQNNFSKKVYKFLEDVGIWKVEPEEGMAKWLNEWEEEPWGEWQYEWDIEFFEILNIAYHCNELEEVNDIYKLVWFIWLFEIFPQEIHPNAKIIWKNLAYWKNIIDNELTEKVLQNQPEEVNHEVDELDDNLSIEEKLKALKRKFSK